MYNSQDRTPSPEELVEFGEAELQEIVEQNCLQRDGFESSTGEGEEPVILLNRDRGSGQSRDQRRVVWDRQSRPAAIEVESTDSEGFSPRGDIRRSNEPLRPYPVAAVHSGAQSSEAPLRRVVLRPVSPSPVQRTGVEAPVSTRRSAAPLPTGAGPSLQESSSARSSGACSTGAQIQERHEVSRTVVIGSRRYPVRSPPPPPRQRRRSRTPEAEEEEVSYEEQELTQPTVAWRRRNRRKLLRQHRQAGHQ